MWLILPEIATLKSISPHLPSSHMYIHRPAGTHMCTHMLIHPWIQILMPVSNTWAFQMHSNLSPSFSSIFWIYKVCSNKNKKTNSLVAVLASFIIKKKLQIHILYMYSLYIHILYIYSLEEESIGVF